MAFVQFSQVSLAFGERDILKDVSVNLQTGTKAALTGANGAGKSTLIKIMAGLVEPDSGKRVAQKDARIAYLPQSGLVHHGCSLREEADKAFQWGYEVQNEIDALGDELKKNSSPALLEKHYALMTKLEESGWHRRSSLAESVLLGLGFSREDFDKQTELFSGGWQMRIALAKALMASPDILLLDEPTNDLDMETLDLLADLLAEYKGTVITVSHDRDFLDNVATEILGFEGVGNIHENVGGYSDYAEIKKLREKEAVASVVAAKQETAPRIKEKKKRSYKEEREYVALPETIEKLEADIAELQTLLGTEEVYTNAPKLIEVQAQLAEKEKLLETAYERFEILDNIG